MTAPRLALIIFAVMFAWGVYHSMSGPADVPGAIREERARSAPPPDRILIENAEYAIQQGLRDPSSAQFRNSAVHIAADSQRVVCGEVNAKNGFGGYAGYERFVSTGRASFLESQMDAKSFALTWKTLCAGGATWRPVYP